MQHWEYYRGYDKAIMDIYHCLEKNGLLYKKNIFLNGQLRSAGKTRDFLKIFFEELLSSHESKKALLETGGLANLYIGIDTSKKARPITAVHLKKEV